MKRTNGRIRVRFWGVRGSIAAPGADTSRHGGNTSCVTVHGGDPMIILDLGTGARALGEELVKRGPKRLAVFLSHLHSDHIAGLPFFAPLYDRRFTIDIFGPPVENGGLRAQLKAFASPPFFPVPLLKARARVHFRALNGGTSFQLGTFRIQTDYANHPWPTLGYRIQNGSKILTYVSDHEPWSNFHHRLARRAAHHGDVRLLRLARQADLLILDAQYSERELKMKRGWGHGTPSYATRMAGRAGVKRLALFHHDPSHSDGELKKMLKASSDSSGPRVLLAREGLVLRF